MTGSYVGGVWGWLVAVWGRESVGGGRGNDKEKDKKKHVRTNEFTEKHATNPQAPFSETKMRKKPTTLKIIII